MTGWSSHPMRLRATAMPKKSPGDVAIVPDEEWQTAMSGLDRWVTTAVSAPLLSRYGYAFTASG